MKEGLVLAGLALLLIAVVWGPEWWERRRDRRATEEASYHEPTHVYPVSPPVLIDDFPYDWAFDDEAEAAALRAEQFAGSLAATTNAKVRKDEAKKREERADRGRKFVPAPRRR